MVVEDEILEKRRKNQKKKKKSEVKFLSKKMNKKIKN